MILQNKHAPVAAENGYPVRTPLKSATTSSSRANSATECDNVTCPAAGEITIRQPHLGIRRNQELNDAQPRLSTHRGEHVGIAGDHGCLRVR
jgi:hypothetical protein